VYWYSNTEVYLSKNKLKHNKNIKNRLKRCEDILNKKIMNYKPVNDLVFVVHGMAQKLYKNKIIKCCDQ
jgi:hypothetical protein